MAFIIKKPVIRESRKENRKDTQNYHENTFYNTDVEKNNDAVNSDISESSFRDDTEFNGLKMNSRTEIEFVDDKLLYKGNYYLPENKLEEYITSEIQDKKSELEDKYQNVMQSGYEKGFQEGLEKGVREYDEKKNEVRRLLASVNKLYDDQLDEAESIVKDLVFVAICKSFGELLKHKDERLLVIQNVITSLKNSNPTKIKVSQYDFSTLFESGYSDIPSKYNIEADSRVELGGCIVETDNGILDGRLETQIGKLNEAIRAQAE